MGERREQPELTHAFRSRCQLCLPDAELLWTPTNSRFMGRWQTVCYWGLNRP